MRGAFAFRVSLDAEKGGNHMTALSGLNATAKVESSQANSTIVENEDRKLFLKLFHAIEPQRKHTVPKHLCGC